MSEEIKTGSPAGQLSNYDKVSTAIYGVIGFIAVFITEIITKLMPFLKLDVVIVDNQYLALTLGNFITVFLFAIGVLIKKLSQNRTNIVIK